MEYNVIEIYPNKHRIYDVANDLVLPKNFLTVEKANTYIIQQLGAASKKTQFYSVHTVMGFN